MNWNAGYNIKYFGQLKFITDESKENEIPIYMKFTNI